MKRVLVLMSTYNGEKYLREQLDSLFSQKDVDMTLLVRDDGSSDGTISVLEEYCIMYPSKIKIIRGANCGCKDSFFLLMKEAVKSYPEYDYYAFSDQDDIWLDDKLISGVNALDKEKNPIKLYYCDPQFVDEDLNTLDIKPIPARNTLEESFILQPCIGCGMIFSPSVLKNGAKADSTMINIHDAWIYRVTLALGGTILKDRNPHILYRQHSSNVIGYNQSLRGRWKRRLKLFIDAECWRSKQAVELLRLYDEMIPEKEERVLMQMVSYKSSLLRKFNIIRNIRFRSLKPFHNVMFYIGICFGKI